MSDDQNNQNAMHELKTSEPTESVVRSMPLLCRVLLWVTRREISKAQKSMEWVEESLRLMKMPNSSESARNAVREIKETADWVRTRHNDQAQRPA
jgi:hypothetical protein